LPPLKIKWGVISGFVAIAHDIRETRLFIDELKNKSKEVELELSERKKAETTLKTAYEQLQLAQVQLLQSEKMSAVERLAGRMAHELNNPLAIILGFGSIDG